MEKLLCGLPADASFHDAVDALDQKTRAGLLDEVATEFTALGIFARAGRCPFSRALGAVCGADVSSVVRQCTRCAASLRAPSTSTSASSSSRARSDPAHPQRTPEPDG